MTALTRLERAPPLDPRTTLASLGTRWKAAGLDPYLGFLHQVDYGRPSFALDIVEPFRHPVADRFVLTMVNKRVLDASDFESGGPGHGVFLKPAAMKRYFAEYERWMLAKADGRTGFRECLRNDVEKLCAALRGKTGFDPWRCGAGWQPVGNLPQIENRPQRNGGFMQYVVCYDIADDARRTRVSSLLLDFGTRIQESVFVAHLDEDLKERMRERLKRVVNEDFDKVHVFEMCAACDKRTWTLGQGDIVADPDYYIV